LAIASFLRTWIAGRQAGAQDNAAFMPIWQLACDLSILTEARGWRISAAMVGFHQVFTLFVA
jgi:hypothetical protein